jgi:hypothetical protein
MKGWIAGGMSMGSLVYVPTDSLSKGRYDILVFVRTSPSRRILPRIETSFRPAPKLDAADLLDCSRYCIFWGVPYYDMHSHMQEGAICDITVTIFFWKHGQLLCGPTAGKRQVLKLIPMNEKYTRWYLGKRYK